MTVQCPPQTEALSLCMCICKRLTQIYRLPLNALSKMNWALCCCPLSPLKNAIFARQGLESPDPLCWQLIIDEVNVVSVK